MRICLVNFDPLKDGGGMSWSQHRITNILTDVGLEVHLVRLASFIDDREWYAKTQTVRDLGVLYPKTRVFDITPWLSPPDTSYAAHEVSSALEQLDERFNYDIFHCLGLDQAAYLVTHVAHRRDKPVIISGRGSDINRGLFRLKNLAGLIWMLENADWLTFVSAAMRDKANQIARCLDRSSVILNSTDQKYFKSCFTSRVEHRNWREKPIVFGGAGILTLKKGADILVQVLKILINENRNVRICWIGELGAANAVQGRFTSSIAELIDAGFICITGLVPHECMLSYLKMLDIFILASPDEGCPNVLLEAMLAKRPIVATTVGAIPEIIRDSIEGILVPPYSIDHIVGAIIELIEKPQLRVRLGQAAYDRVITCCNLEREKEAWLECYDRVRKLKSRTQ
jgi:glycosyltransferase involved in cell wall biosynthesis